MRILRLLSIMLLVNGLILAASAQNSSANPQPNALPVFHVSTLDGTQVSSGDWTLPGHWVLIYIQSNCRSCRMALTQLKLAELATQNGTQQAPAVDLGQTLVVVFAGTDAADAKDLAKQFPWLKQANWYIDSSFEAEKALSLHGAPAFFGIDRNTVAWKFSGITGNPGAFNETLLKWMQSKPPVPGL